MPPFVYLPEVVDEDFPGLEGRLDLDVLSCHGLFRSCLFVFNNCLFIKLQITLTIYIESC